MKPDTNTDDWLFLLPCFLAGGILLGRFVEANKSAPHYETGFAAVLMALTLIAAACLLIGVPLAHRAVREWRAARRG